ncbi:lob domain-containing protein 4 [Quercus suber]|uniref:Lob domain-containing protein 4 n=1 Tax=Quercus suber TaxID=58331 RepID=A0AAW0KEW8_QUESU
MKESRKQGAMSPCAACKLLRRRCAQDCVFAPYFPADEPQKFANVHKVFGASNVNKMLQQQVDILQTQLALAQAEVVHMRMRQYPSSSNNPPDNNDSPSPKLMSSQTKSFFSMDMVVDQANLGESLWSC